MDGERQGTQKPAAKYSKKYSAAPAVKGGEGRSSEEIVDAGWRAVIVLVWFAATYWPVMWWLGWR